ncbi:hypothetical protein [Paenibacillus etheri]|nr:hypothetical protein [Paenibacillus etheri]
MEWLRSILLVVSLSTLGYFSYVKSSTPMEADMRTHSSKVLGRTALLMDEYFAHIANSIQVVSVNQNVIETLKRLIWFYQILSYETGGRHIKMSGFYKDVSL